MIKLLVQIYFKQISIFLVSSLVLIWASFATVIALKKETHVLVIRVNKQGTEALTVDNKKNRFAQDRINLSYFFVNSHYSYNPKTYDEQKRKSLELFSEESYEKEFSKALAEKREISKRDFNQEAIIENYFLRDNNIMELEVLKTIFVTGAKPRSIKSRIFLNLAPIDRVKENPYGFEITKIREVKRY